MKGRKNFESWLLNKYIAHIIFCFCIFMCPFCERYLHAYARTAIYVAAIYQPHNFSAGSCHMKYERCFQRASDAFAYMHALLSHLRFTIASVWQHGLPTS